MIPVGIGLDLVEVERVDRLLKGKGDRALRRLLTEAERAYCAAKAMPARHIAARLAAKEAAYKALAHTGQAGAVGWREVEVTRAVDGRPTLALHGRARATAERLKIASVLVSLTHSEAHAAAVVILFR